MFRTRLQTDTFGCRMRPPTGGRNVQLGNQYGGWHQMAGGVPYSRPVLGMGVRTLLRREAMASGWKRGRKETKLVWIDLKRCLGSDCSILRKLVLQEVVPTLGRKVGARTVMEHGWTV